MDAPEKLTTTRLVLRQWRDDDIDALAAINGDPEVMRHFFAPLTREQTERTVADYQASFAAHGFGPWAVEVAETGELIGLAGLLPVRFEAHFTPAVHLIAKFAAHAWRRHFGTEAAQEAIRDGFQRVQLEEIVAFTPKRNEPSWQGMASLGMTHEEADDFTHPGLTDGDPLRDHVLYRLRTPETAGRPPA
ncbi:MAG TPA: GNAT family N-acetyltransferase [Aeromicrobium sp.]|nr:GNAT family N-acetyltransferase [Aeromicrobium sp.]